MAEKQVTIKVSVRTAGIQQQIRKVNSNLSQLSNQANKANASLLRMGGGFRITATQIGTLTGGFFALQGAFRVLRFGVTSMIEFEKSMSAVQAVSGATGATFQRMSNLARELGATTTFSANQAAEGLKFLSMAGFTAQESMNSLTATLRLAQAGAMDLGRSADIMSNIMKAMKMEAKDSAKAGDILAQAMRSSNTSIEQLGDAFKYAGGIAGSLGLNLEETTAALSVLSNAGLQASMAGTGLRQVLVKLANPSAAMREVFSQVGIEVDNLDLSAGNLGNTLRTLANAGLSTGEIFKAFEARAGTAFTILQGGIGDFDELEKKNKNAQGTLEEMSKVMTDNLAGSIKLLQSAFSELFISQESFGQGMRGVVDTLTTFINILNGTATSTDQFGNDMSETTKKANILLFAVQALGVVLGGLAVSSAIVGLRNLGLGMASLFTSTTTTNLALSAQGKILVTTTTKAPIMAKVLNLMSAGMYSFTGATKAGTFAVRGFAVALASTGIGALVVILGAAIGQLMSFMAQSKATKDQAVGDANAIKGSVDKLAGGYDGLRQEAKKGGEGAIKILQQLGESTKKTSALQDMLSKKKPAEITSIDQLRTTKDVTDSITAMRNKIVELRSLQKEVGFKSSEGKEMGKTIKALNEQITLYSEQGENVVNIRMEEAIRNEALKTTNKLLAQNVKDLEEFSKKVNEQGNEEMKAKIDFQDANKKMKQELTFLQANLRSSMQIKSGDVNIDALRDEILNTTDFAGFKIKLQTAIDNSEVEELDEAMQSLVEKNFFRVKDQLTSILGATDDLSDSTKKAIAQFAMIDSMKITSLGTGSVFEQVLGDDGAFEEASDKFDTFKRKLQELREIQDIAVNIEFNEEAESVLGKLDAQIAQARFELQGMNNEFEHSTRMTGDFGDSVTTLASALRNMGLARNSSFANVDASAMFSGDFDAVGASKEERNAEKQRIASAIRGMEALDRVRRKRTFVEAKDGGFSVDTNKGSFKNVGDSLKSAIMEGSAGGANASMDLINLLIAEGFGSNRFEVMSRVDASSGKELETTFATLEGFAERVKNKLSEQSEESDEIISKEEKLLQLQQKREDALEAQNQKLKEQREALKGLEAQMEVDKLEADFKIGADDTTEADADMARAELELQKRLESFKKKARKVLDEEVKASVALKRGELTEQGGVDSDAKKKQLAEFENELRKKSNDKFAELVDKQARIFEQTRFAEQIENSIKSLKEKLDKFEKSRKEQQDRATGFIGFAKDITAKDEEDQEDSREAGVSSLAKIGGGGGVGRGGDDKQQKIVDVNQKQLTELRNIARSIFGVENFEELGEGIKEDLIGAMKGLDKLVKEDKLTKEEGEGGLQEVAKRLAQIRQDREDSAIGFIQGLLKDRTDEEKAPDPLENAQVQDLIKSFDKLSEAQQAQTINRLKNEEAPDALIDELLKNIGNENFAGTNEDQTSSRSQELAKSISQAIADTSVTIDNNEIEVDIPKVQKLFEDQLRSLGSEDFDSSARVITDAVANETGLQNELQSILQKVKLERESEKPQRGLDFEQSPKFELEVPKIDIPSVQPLKPIDAGQELAEKDSLIDKVRRENIRKEAVVGVANGGLEERNSVNDLAPLESIDQVQDSLAVPLTSRDLPSEVFDKFADSEEDRKKLIAVATANRLNEIQSDSGFVPVPSPIAGREGLMDVTRAVKMPKRNSFSAITADETEDGEEIFFASSQAQAAFQAREDFMSRTDGTFDERDRIETNSLILPAMSQGKDESLEDFMSRVDAMNERLKENRQKAIDMVTAMREEGVDLPVISGEAKTLEIGKDQDNEKQIQERKSKFPFLDDDPFNPNFLNEISGLADPNAESHFIDPAFMKFGALQDVEQNARAVGKDPSEFDVVGKAMRDDKLQNKLQATKARIQEEAPKEENRLRRLEEKEKQEEANRLSKLERDPFDPNISNNASVKPIVSAPKTRLPKAEDLERDPMDVIKPIPSPEPMPVKLDDIPIIHIPELKQLREGLAGGSIMASTEKKIPTPTESPIESLMQMKGESDVSGLDALVGLQTQQNKLLKSIYDESRRDKPNGGGLNIEEL